MKTLQCPKCGHPYVKPIYHADDGSCNRGKRKAHITSSKEHLHYYCICTYDFIDEVVERD